MMNWRAQFEPDGSLVTLTVSGVARVDGFTVYLDGLLDDPAWRGGTPVLVDYQGLDIASLTSEDVRSVVDLHIPYLTRIGGSPIAVVVSRPVDFGLVRMWESLAGERFPLHRVFYRVNEALGWLDTHRRRGNDATNPGTPA